MTAEIGTTVAVQARWVDDDADLLEAMGLFILSGEGDLDYAVGHGERHGIPAVVFFNPHSDKGLMFSVPAARALVAAMRHPHNEPPDQIRQDWFEIAEQLTRAVEVAEAGGIQ